MGYLTQTLLQYIKIEKLSNTATEVSLNHFFPTSKSSSHSFNGFSIPGIHHDIKHKVTQLRNTMKIWKRQISSHLKVGI